MRLFQEEVKVRMEKAPDEVRCFGNCEICVLRSGKARKTDPPIPEDLAPLSGGELKPRRSPLSSSFAEESSFPDVYVHPEQPETAPEEEAVAAAEALAEVSGEGVHVIARSPRSSRPPNPYALTANAPASSASSKRAPRVSPDASSRTIDVQNGFLPSRLSIFIIP